MRSQSYLLEELQDIFVLAMTCTYTYKAFEEYVKSLPELLTDLTKKIIDGQEQVPDGYFNFKRV
jgi:hypothetical protein